MIKNCLRLEFGAKLVRIMADDNPRESSNIDEEGIKGKLLGDEGLGKVVDDLDQGISKLEHMRDEVTPGAAPDEDDFDARMASLQEKGRQVYERREAAKVENERRFEKEQDSAQGLGVGLTIAYAIIGAPILFYLIGLGIDKLTHRQDAAIYALGGVVLGIFAAVQIANRQNARK